jgi:hypothetical protein
MEDPGCLLLKRAVPYFPLFYELIPKENHSQVRKAILQGKPQKGNTHLIFDAYL